MNDSHRRLNFALVDDYLPKLLVLWTNLDRTSAHGLLLLELIFESLLLGLSDN